MSMVHVRIVEPSSPEWKKWRQDATEAARELRKQLRDTGGFTVDEKLYRRLKRVYFDLYHGKCVYCESRLGVDSWDQLDHFRPKDAIWDADRKKVVIGKAKTPHPGYYWLAYDWKNLLPACAICNVRKGACFPLMPASLHATQPGQENAEKPVFIHPSFSKEHPERHFEYIPKTGFVKAKTARGRLIINLLDLNREPLVDERREAYKACIELLKDYFDDLKKPGREPDVETMEDLAKYTNGVAEYSLVGRHALRECKKAFEQLLAPVTQTD